MRKFFYIALAVIILLPSPGLATEDICEIRPESVVEENYYAGLYAEQGKCDTEKNIERAKVFYLKAANDNYPPAQHKMGELHFTGALGEPDYAKAKEWYLKAGHNGYGLSQLRLGFLYAEAHFGDLKVDLQEAEQWFIKAAHQDSGDARFRLGNFYRNYVSPPKKDLAIQWLTQAAEGGHRVAMFDLARMLKDEGDIKGYLHWMTRSAEMGVVPALLTLTDHYLKGEMVEKDKTKAKLYLESAAKRGSLRAKKLLKDLK